MKYTLRYTISFFCASFLGLTTGLAQQNPDISLNIYTNQTEIKATRSVTLTSGFHVPYNGNVRIFTGADFQNCTPIKNSPSNDQNYIMTRIFKVPNVTGDINLSTFNTCQVNQTIQYLDGLGRPLQTVLVQGSPGFADVVQPVAYDAFGRESKKYLPYAIGSNGGAYRTDALTGQAAFYNGTQAGLATTAYPYSLTVFEPSPLNRISAQGAPGESWQPVSGHAVKIEYGANTTDVKLWTVVGGGASATNYSEGKLSKTTLKDENWVSANGKGGTTDEYKDFEDRVILKRIWESDTKSLSTYYVYDDLGNLRYVLPPAVNENGLNTINSFNESQDVFKQFIYGYHYDGRKRVIEKKVPGKGWEHTVYNQLNQVVLTQDSNQRVNNLWLFTKYDAFGRVIATGPYTDASKRAALQGAVDGQSVFWENRVDGDIGYDKKSFPQNSTIYYTINYYDDYSFPGNSMGLPSGSQMPAERTKSLLTATKTNILGTASMLLSVNYYDGEGRLIQSKGENHLGGKDIVNNSYNFAGELTGSVRVHTGSATGVSTTISDRYAYDHVGRKIATMESINGEPETVLSKLDYTETGQLISKKLHSTDGGASFLQQTNFTYNERNWLSTSKSDQFSMQLKYNDGVLPQWNGNISGQVWGQGNLNNTFTYTYDKLNRLTNADAGAVLKLGETIGYDVMGNITTLTRDQSGTNRYTGYTGNQLVKVEGFTNSTYGYDGNGNLISDGGKGITISYNMLNLPAQVRGAKILNYLYDATGNKLKKESNTGGITDYVGGIQYTGGAIEFIQTEDGLARRNGSKYGYEYSLTDHLGNNRTTFYKNPASGKLEILQQDDYYAFGLRKPVKTASSDNKYLYNKKELQEELGAYDYGARFYDPVIGRFSTIDPLAELSRKVSPYSYALNNPIRFIDVDGMYAGEAGNYQKGGADFNAVLAYYGIGNNQEPGKTDPDDEVKKKGNQVVVRGVLLGFRFNDKSENYDGMGYWKTNFVGPGPDIDPRKLNFVPKDMVDLAAFEHDISYYEARVGGATGAFFNLAVQPADEKLAKTAFNVMKQYGKGGIDPVTRAKISERTYKEAVLVYKLFSTISATKAYRISLPSPVENIRSGFNRFVNSLNVSMSGIH